MKILILTGSPDSYSIKRLVEEGQKRKHGFTCRTPQWQHGDPFHLMELWPADGFQQIFVGTGFQSGPGANHEKRVCL